MSKEGWEKQLCMILLDDIKDKDKSMQISSQENSKNSKEDKDEEIII